MVSNGTPMIPISKSVDGLVRHFVCGRCANVWIPANGQSCDHSSSAESLFGFGFVAEASAKKAAMNGGDTIIAVGG